jgi:hypothetical protein
MAPIRLGRDAESIARLGKERSPWEGLPELGSGRRR